MADNDLRALALACRDGDRRGFETLVHKESRSLMAIAYRYTGDWEAARDLTQDTWMKVHERIHRWDSTKSFRAWLITVHRNGCIDYLRRASIRYEVRAGDEVMGNIRLMSSGDNPEVDMERREFHDRLICALGELSESQRQVFMRVDLEQGDQREVAEVLGIKYATLRTTLHFARKRLASLLRSMEETS